MAEDLRKYNGQPPAPVPLPDRPNMPPDREREEDAAEETDYDAMTVAELRAEATSRGVEVERGARKQDYIDALREADR